MDVDEAMEVAEWLGDQYTPLQIATLYGRYALAAFRLSAEVLRLRRDCAEAYQCVGYTRGSVGYNDPAPSEEDIVRLLDNLSAASSGLPRPHDDLLPWPRETVKAQQREEGGCEN